MKATVIRSIIGAVVLAGAVALVALLPIKEYAASFLSWAQENRRLGALLLGLAYIPATVLFIPGTLLTLGAGFAFGIGLGTLAVSAGSVAGATAAFLVGRSLARGLVETAMAHSPRFTAIDRAVADNGFQIVLLTRLSPLFPFNLSNYAYSLTQVRLRDYVLASWIGMFPGTVMYVYLGSAMKSLSDLVSGRIEGSAAQSGLFLVGLAATVAATVSITRVAKRALAQAVNNQMDAGDRRSN